MQGQFIDVVRQVLVPDPLRYVAGQEELGGLFKTPWAPILPIGQGGNLGHVDEHGDIWLPNGNWGGNIRDSHATEPWHASGPIPIAPGRPIGPIDPNPHRKVPDDPVVPDKPVEPEKPYHWADAGSNYFPISNGLDDVDYYWNGDNVKKDKNDSYFRDPGNPPKKYMPGQARPEGRQERRRIKEHRSKGYVEGVPITQSAPILTNKTEQLRLAPLGGIVITRREKYCNVDGRLDPKVQNYDISTQNPIPYNGCINPGFSFLWLKQFARLYEKYRILSLTFHYVPLVSYATNGRVVFGLDLDSNDDNTTVDEIQALTLSQAIPVTREAFFPVPKGVLKEMFGSNIATGADKWIIHTDTSDENAFLYHFGRVWIGSHGVSTAAGALASPYTCGEVWVEYSVELLQPHVSTDPAIYASDRITCVPTSRTDMWGTAADFYWHSQDPYPASVYDSSPMGWTKDTTTVRVHTPGQYMFSIYATGTVFTGTMPTWTLAPSGSGNAITNVHLGYDATATHAVMIAIMTINVAGTTIVADWTASCTTLTVMDVRITQYTYAYACPGPIHKVKNLEKDILMIEKHPDEAKEEVLVFVDKTTSRLKSR